MGKITDWIKDVWDRLGTEDFTDEELVASFPSTTLSPEALKILNEASTTVDANIIKDDVSAKEPKSTMVDKVKVNEEDAINRAGSTSTGGARRKKGDASKENDNERDI
jgi:hypothetical protein